MDCRHMHLFVCLALKLRRKNTKFQQPVIDGKVANVIVTYGEDFEVLSQAA